MSEPFGRLRRFFAELKRRSVYQVAVAYAAVGFVLIEAASLIFPALNIPSWAYSLVVVFVLFGFPIALVIAWAFDVTPKGLRRTPAAGEPVERAGEPDGGQTRPTEGRGPRARRAVGALVGLGLVGATVAGGWYLVGGGGESPEVADRSVAVLPFEARGREEPGTFTAGMHAALSSRLANVSDLRVSPSRAVQAYEDTSVPMARIAGELGVGWVVTGNVQSTDEEVRVIVELVNPATGTQRWSDDYTRDLTTESLFDLQSEISREIARSLEAELSAEERERIERRPTEDLDAYRLYARGRSELNTRTEEGMRQAVDYFQRAIERDSSYALAWSGLADAIGLLARKPYASFEGTLPDHEEAARRALDLDPDLAEAHASMGLVHFEQQNGPEALRELQRAVELKPSYVQAHHWLGFALLYMGRREAGHEHVRLAVDLDPRHTAARGVLIWLLATEGRSDQAMTHLGHRDAARAPTTPWLRGFLMYHAKRWEELESYAREQTEDGGRSAEMRFFLTRIAAVQGDTVSAREHLGKIEGSSPSDRSRLFEGFAHAALGEVDEAFAAWGDVEEWGPDTVVIRYFYPDLVDSLRDDPRYEELVRKINEQWGLNPDGSLPEGVDVSFDPSKSDA